MTTLDNHASRDPERHPLHQFIHISGEQFVVAGKRVKVSMLPDGGIYFLRRCLVFLETLYVAERTRIDVQLISKPIAAYNETDMGHRPIQGIAVNAESISAP
jgi:hypothetical protein